MIPTKQKAIQRFMDEARDCAMSMLDNGDYIQRELARVEMDDEIRARAAKLCSEFVGTKADVVRKLSEIGGLVHDGADDDTISSEVRLVVNWFWRDIAQMNELVADLEAAADCNPNCSIAYALLAQSAVNILNPFNRAQKAATSFARKAKPNSPKRKKKRS